MKKRLVILSDYGLDDAVATLHLLENAHLFSGIDIVAIAGNTDKETSFKNAIKLLANFDGDILDVSLVSTFELNQPFATLPSIHGQDGMGDLLSYCSIDELKKQKTEVLSYSVWIAGLKAKNILVVSNGPCTVTKHMLNSLGAFSMVLMAGMVNAEANYNGYEFNQALDVENFDAVVKFPHAIATLDSVRVKSFNLAGYKLEETSLKNKLINRAINFATKRHKDNCYIYDYLAAIFITNPEYFSLVDVKDKWGNKLTEIKVKEGINLLKEMEIV